MEHTAVDEQTILIIDDNPTNLRVAVEHLRPAKAQILTARSGEAGIERARLVRPDLILLDVQMPGIDGFETCRRLKDDPRTRDIPVIFTTVLHSIEDKLSGFAAGGVDYISKPFQVEEMLARVRTHLTIYSLQRALQDEIRQRRQVEEALRKANLELERLSVQDALTQVANRRRFDDYLRLHAEQPERPALSLLMCDVDHFKRYNDGYGHLAGDSCLRQVVLHIGGALRHVSDLLARYGGEEFAVILPDTDLDGARRVAETIQARLRRAAIPHVHSPIARYVTLSIGVACAPPGVAAAPTALIAAADGALYLAKRQGRDRVVCASGEG